jgi:transketolase
VAEQNMINIASGIAATGKIPVIFGISPFLIFRCFEQIKLNICSMQLPVIIAGIGTGLSFSFDGPTHHGTSDLSCARSLPEMNIFSPSDSGSAAISAKLALKYKGPTYCRIDKGLYSKFTNINDSFAIKNGWKEIKKKQSINIISNSFMLEKCFEVLSHLEKENIKIGLVDLFKIKPINSSKLIQFIKKSKFIITVEEHSLDGGIGSIIAELILDNSLDTRLIRLGIKEEQVLTYGTRDSLLENYGLSNKLLEKKIRLIYKKYL